MPKYNGKRPRRDKDLLARGVLDAYIRMLRSTYEGDKTSAKPMWETGKLSIPKRWKAFVKHRTEYGLLVIGSEKLFRERWKAHSDTIRELGAKGHPVCDKCGAYQSVYDRFLGRQDEEAVRERLKADKKMAQHEYEHRGERAYGEDAFAKAELRPHLVTCHNFDSPTSRQLDVPVQSRKARDVAKRVENLTRWTSKMVGVMSAGWGMIAYMSRSALGEGPNLSLTCLYLALLAQEDTGRTLGSRYVVLMDNTGSANKCAEMISFLGWLVLNDNFEDASFFCMIVGHTFNILDQSFSVMIGALLALPIYALSALYASPSTTTTT